MPCNGLKLSLRIISRDFKFLIECCFHVGKHQLVEPLSVVPVYVTMTAKYIIQKVFVLAWNNQTTCDNINHTPGYQVKIRHFVYLFILIFRAVFGFKSAKYLCRMHNKMLKKLFLCINCILRSFGSTWNQVNHVFQQYVLFERRTKSFYMILPLGDARWRHTMRYPGVLRGASCAKIRDCNIQYDTFKKA